MAWEVLTGVIDWWADEGLRDVGRRRFHLAMGKQVGAGLLPRGSIDASRHAFVVRHHPWRLAQVRLDVADSDADGQTGQLTANAPGVVVSWADDATAVLSGSPASQHVVPANESWGDFGLRSMLEPGPLETVVAKPWGRLVTIDGQLLETDSFILPELVSLTASHYEATYDADLDALTSWTAFIDGEVAHRQSLTQLTVISMPTIDGIG
jgi:hypothetical protein